jgi:hypothetical protein
VGFSEPYVDNNKIKVDMIPSTKSIIWENETLGAMTIVGGTEEEPVITQTSQPEFWL